MASILCSFCSSPRWTPFLPSADSLCRELTDLCKHHPEAIPFDILRTILFLLICLLNCVLLIKELLMVPCMIPWGWFVAGIICFGIMPLVLYLILNIKWYWTYLIFGRLFPILPLDLCTLSLPVLVWFPCWMNCFLYWLFYRMKLSDQSSSLSHCKCTQHSAVVHLRKPKTTPKLPLQANINKWGWERKRGGMDEWCSFLGCWNELVASTKWLMCCRMDSL